MMSQHLSSNISIAVPDKGSAVCYMPACAPDSHTCMWSEKAGDVDILRFCVQKFIVNPVIAADGHTYERSAIEQWLCQTSTSYVTGTELAHKRVIPNLSVKSIIASLSPTKT